MTDATLEGTKLLRALPLELSLAELNRMLNIARSKAVEGYKAELVKKVEAELKELRERRAQLEENKLYGLSYYVGLEIDKRTYALELLKGKESK